jgi:hypothetical protein
MKRSSIVNVLRLMALLPFLAACSGGPSPSVQESVDPVQPASPKEAKPYFDGDGGKGTRIAVWLPDAKGLSKEEEWLPAMVQGTLTGDFNKYSKMTVTDRQNLEKILAEQAISASGNFSEDDYVRMGELVNAQYILTGSITKTGLDSFILELSVSDASTGVRKASYPPKPCRLSELTDMTAIKAASETLLAGMGVTLTDAGREALRGVKEREAEAEVSLSKGITAQKSGTVVEALSYYIQSTNYDPSATEAASRLNILSADITSGNMGANVRNDIQWRRQWVERLAEAEQFYANYVKEPTPYHIVYDTSLEQGEINYANETVSIGFTIDLIPDARWIETAVKVINTVRDGLVATGRTADWGLDWPYKSVSSDSPFVGRDENFTVAVELVNDKGTTIGRQSITLQGGWDIQTRYSNAGMPFILTPIIWGRPGAGRIKDTQKVNFSLVDANSITDTLAIRIVSINGTNAETAARNMRISIVTEAEYAKLPEVIAGTDSRGVIKQFSLALDRSGTGYVVVDYNGTSQNVIIPSGVFGTPVIGIGQNAFRNNNLTGVTVPDSVTSIGESAFDDNNLTGVTIPDSVTSIGSFAFHGNPLTSLTIPANLPAYGIGHAANPIFSNEFDTFYFRNGRKAGTYTYKFKRNRWMSQENEEGEWTYQP